MKIDEINNIKLYFDTNTVQGVYTLPDGASTNATYKLSVRASLDWRTPSMCDAVGVVDAVAKTVTFTLNTFTQEFERVCRIQDTAYLEVYTDAAASKEVFLQRKIFIGSRVGSIAGQPPVPSDEYVQLKSEMPTATPDHFGEVVLFVGTNTATYTKGHYYKCILTGTAYEWEDITGTGATQKQADWNQTDTAEKDYIKNKPTIPGALSDLTADATHRTVTDTEKATWNGKLAEPDGKTANKYLGTDAQNNLAWKTVEEPNYPVTSVNGQTGAVTLNTSDIPMPVVALAGTAVPSAGKIYTHTVAAGEVFTFFTPVEGEENLFELDITQPATAVTYTLPNVTWKFGVPALNVASSTVQLRFRYINGVWEGWATPEMSEYLKKFDASNICLRTPNGTVILENANLFDSPNENYIQFGGGYTGGSFTTLYLNAKETIIDRKKFTILGWHGSIKVDANGDITIKDSHIYTDGTDISTITTTSGIATITPQDNKIYKHTAVASDSIVIDTAALTASHGVNFELLITQTNPASSITLPTNVTWIGTPPTCSGDGKIYALHIEWNGARLVGWQKYEI